MTVLSACQSASIRLISKRPSTIFSASGNKFEWEIKDLVGETAAAIAKAHDWRRLTALAPLVGDASKIAFDLPSDYDRMPVKAAVNSSTWERYRYEAARDLDQWHDIQTYLTAGTPGYWIILGGKMQIFPAMAVGETATFYYQSKNWAANSTGTPKASFTDDDDVFLLPERLLTLGLIWRWRAQKRLEYAEDMANYEVALAEEAGREKGSRMIAVGTPRWQFDGALTYPGQLG